MHDDVFAGPGMQALRGEMLQMLIQTSDTDLQKLEHAMATSDNQQAMQVLHRILGALHLFTTDRVIADGRALMAGLSGTNANETLLQLPAYLKSLRRVLTELARQARIP